MHKKSFLACFLTISMVLTQTLFTNTVLAQTTNGNRCSGSDRYKTAVAISQKGWVSSDYAVLARGDDFADALCAGPLASKNNAPILLTQSNSLNADTLTELKRLNVKHIIIVGGYGAVSSNDENALKSAGFSDINRIFGNDRYETSVKIAEKLGNTTDAALAVGTNYPDALSISPIAAKSGMPILLANKGSLPTAVDKYVKDSKITKTYIVGGTGVISDAVKNSVPGSTRIGGNNRYETNVQVMQQFASQLNFNKIYVAVGNNFADALTGAVIAAKDSSPVVLVGNTIPDATANFLKSKISIGSSVIALGGEGAVSHKVLQELSAYINQLPVSENYNKAGIYGPKDGVNTVSGNVIVSAPDVTLQNTEIKGDLLLAESIGTGNVTLKNVKVEGNTFVYGGGPHSVALIDFNGHHIIVNVHDSEGVRLVAQGSTSIESVEMQSNGKLEESNLTGNGFTNVTIPEGATVTLIGNFDEVDIQSKGVSVNVISGTIGKLNITKNAEGAKIDLSSGASVTTLQADAPATITGTGRIVTANITSEGVTIAQKPTTVNVTNGITANVGGSKITGGQTTQTNVNNNGNNNVNNNNHQGDNTHGSDNTDTELENAKNSAKTAMSAYLAAGGKNTDDVYIAVVNALKTTDTANIKAVTANLNKATVALNDALTQAKEGIEAAEAKLAEAQEKVEAANSALAEAKEKVEAANAAANAAAAQNQEAIEAANSALAEAQEKVEAANSALAEAQEKVEAANAALAQAQANVETANAALAHAQEAVEAAEATKDQGKINEANTKLAEAKEKVEAENAALAEAKEKVEAENAALAEANEKVEAQNSALAQAKEKVEAANSALAEAQEKVEAANAALAEANEKVEAANGELAQAKETGEKALSAYLAVGGSETDPVYVTLKNMIAK